MSKPSYRAPKWALMVRLMQKERLKSPQKSPILENQAIWVILAILAKTAILVILPSHFQTRVDAPKKKSQSRSCLHQRDRATVDFWWSLYPPEARQKFLLPGVSVSLGSVCKTSNLTFNATCQLQTPTHPRKSQRWRRPSRSGRGPRRRSHLQPRQDPRRQHRPTPQRRTTVPSQHSTRGARTS